MTSERAHPMAATGRATAVAVGLLILAGLVVYCSSFSVPFLLDDSLLIQGNPTIRHLWPLSTVLSPPESVGSGGRPLLNLTLAVNYAFGGPSARGYHALNLLIHLLGGLTLFGIVRRTLAQLIGPGLFRADACSVAFIATLLWIVHPLQTESVTYISQRAESLMGLCYLLTLYCFIRGAEEAARARWLSFSVIACALGMASKEVMVTAPVMVLAYDRLFLSGTFREAWRNRRPFYVGLASTWLLLAFLVIVSHLGQRGVGYGQGVTWWSYLLTEIPCVARYLRLAVWPHPLVFDYGSPLGVAGVGQITASAALLALLVGATLFALWRQRPVGWFGCWFFVILLPTSSVIPVVLQPMAENRMYLSLAAVVALVVTAAYALAGRSARFALLGLALCFGWLTIRRNMDYGDGLALWTDTVAKQPASPRAHDNLGCEYLSRGRLPEAIAQFEQAIHLNPNYAEAHANLGSALGRSGRPAEAVGHLEAALRLNPGNLVARTNLGAALIDLGRPADAAPHFEAILRLSPDYPAAHFGLGNVLLHLNRATEAISHFETALRNSPDYVEAHNGLAMALSLSGRFAEAVAHYERVLVANPGDAVAHNNLASCLRQAGRFLEAIAHYREALRLAPGFADAHCNLADVLSQAGHADEAIREYETALRLNPNLTRAREHLAQLLPASP